MVDVPAAKNNEPNQAENDKGEVSQEVPLLEVSKKDLFRPATVTKIMHKKYLSFGALVGLYYTIQFICCVSACNFYSDVSRLAPCPGEAGALITGEDASAVYDLAIKMAGVWHVIEWIRTTVLLTVIFVGASSLMYVWYGTAVFTALYGVASFITVHAVAFGTDGRNCADVQETRAMWLVIEVVFFWVFFAFYQFPMAVLLCFGKKRISDALQDSEDEDED